MLFGEMNVFRAKPCDDLLPEYEENEVYCLVEPEGICAVLFPDGGGSCAGHFIVRRFCPLAALAGHRGMPLEP